MSDTAPVYQFQAHHLWQGAQWQTDAAFGVDSTGRIIASAGESPEYLDGWVLPGMPNLHSHAFQRAMAGLAERRGPGDDSFWTWRETMYGFAERIDPDTLQAIAAQLYVEMLKAGYTQVCEFHYLHHQPDGSPYAQPEAMSLALIEAAREAGIALTLLPVLYMSGGFDGRALSPRQRRFGNHVDGYLQLLGNLRKHESHDVRVGVALHSLRAIPEHAWRGVMEHDALKNGPIHIHIAEQIGEVQDCLATRGARPVEWLLDHAPVDHRWCLVHATHLTESETAQLAHRGAIAGLCPTTEANLGDGLFPLARYIDAGGVLGIGSDSHISISPVEELRWLEYGQRLSTRHRNVAARHAGESVGETLWRAALKGGALAADLPIGSLTPAQRADFIVLDSESPLLAARDARSAMDSFLFAGNTPLVRHVMAGGRWVVRDFHHRDEARIASRYRAAMQRLA
ncbi:formimidoylglutamate deiminase [Dyella nitratireducens]|uniref:Formimidoylglutamate deiminase n=1 Tax=Dyella nitratireducens TaxID=1849580 RepID=A0ABQ1GXR5_9GAMM|nr:formimidoylglutamate deiminase [Dyella nitratireducens]GGA52046.1 formimidoylglutamate deiminase [Dyella nitratireducens]GLQ41623.1 formimidoylglutamate deiminase [Dyella nitratireducens]